MTKTKYAILSTAAILPLLALAPFLQLQIVKAQTDNSDNGDNSDSSSSDHTVCKIIVAGGAILLGHPELSSLGQVICEP
jgi:hypothetical protein